MKKKNLDIFNEDKELIAVNKPSGLLTVSTEKEKERTLFKEVSDYEKTKFKSNKVFIVNRLDKDTSGIVLFAKNQKIKKLLQDNWNELVKTRGYIAIVEGKTDTEGTVKSYLKERRDLSSYSTDEKDGKLAITTYKKIKSNRKYTVLNIEIFTGRKNQIRVHMQDINHPIVGDKKYGSKLNPIGRMALHANKLVFTHPINNKLYSFESKIPKEFEKLL